VTLLWIPLGARLAIASRRFAGKVVAWRRSPQAEPAPVNEASPQDTAA
jgi:hypothetical protein